MNTRIKHLDPIRYKPTHIGPFGHAWHCDLPAVRAMHEHEKNWKNPADATICIWLVYAPHAHPIWAYYNIMAIHLRPIPGTAEPKRYALGATHEAWVWALDPDKEPDLLRPCHTWLRPANFAGQWVVQHRNPVDADKEACAKIEKCILEIVNGTLNPDTDAQSQWEQRFGSSNALY